MIIHRNWECLIFRPKWWCLHRNLTTSGFEWIEDLETTKNGMKLMNYVFQRIYTILILCIYMYIHTFMGLIHQKWVESVILWFSENFFWLI